MHDIDELIENGLAYLIDNRYSQSTITHHKTSWNRLRKWLLENDFTEFDHDAQIQYLKYRKFDDESFKQSEFEVRTHIRRLLEISEQGAISKPVCSKIRYEVPEGLTVAYELYGIILKI